MKTPLLAILLSVSASAQTVLTWDSRSQQAPTNAPAGVLVVDIGIADQRRNPDYDPFLRSISVHPALVDMASQVWVPWSAGTNALAAQIAAAESNATALATAELLSDTNYAAVVSDTEIDKIKNVPDIIAYLKKLRDATVARDVKVKKKEADSAKRR